MKAALKEWWTNHRAQSLRNEAEAMKEQFDLCEKDGKIYLIHCGTAYSVMPEYASAAEIAAKLDEARKAALEFEGL